MKKIIKVFVICTVLSTFMCSTAYASENIPSLDEVVSDTTTKDTSTSDKINVQENKQSVIDALTNAADVSEHNEQAAKVGSAAEKGASLVIQIMSYGITILLIMRIALDLIYIGIPFLRSVLANGYMGNPHAAGGPQQQQPGMGMGGGFGGGFGNRYGGGMGMGMNNMSMQSQQIGVQTAMNNQPKQGKLQLVSNAALNAVATENMVGPDGEAHSAFKTYVKDMVIVLVITPVLLTLAVTGILTQVGFTLGQLIVDGLRNLMNGGL